MTQRMREYYASNPLMVSSPFGGVDSINATLVRDVFAKLGIDVSGRSVLDVGCGRGFMREYVNAQGGRYVGVDLLAHGSGFPLGVADATRLPFPDASFDGVFCVDAFEHIPDGVAAAREFLRVLRPGGFMFLSAPNYGNVAGLAKWFCEHWGGYAPDTWAPFRRWQAQELEQPLTEAGVRRIYREAGFGRFTRIGHAPEVYLGVFPWTDHPCMPEALQFRLQRLFRRMGPAIMRVWPGASLHGFWKIEV